jgi:hypothetical protein
MDSGAGDTPGGPRKWSERARRSWKTWRNFYPSLDYARGDPRTFYVPIDRAAHMAGLCERNFYDRYLASGRLPYVVKTWFHGRKMRRKSFVQRSALLELLARELCEAAKLHMSRRGRPAIPRKATVADLERLLDRQLSKSG